MDYEILHPSQQWLGRVCPVECSPVGYAYLIERFGLRVPVPLRLFGIGTKQRKRQDWDFDDYTGWTVLEPRYWPKHGLRGQLTFALKYEGVDLAVLKKLFTEVPEAKAEIEAWVQEQPNSQYARRCWFWWEKLGFEAFNIRYQGNLDSLFDAVDDHLQLFDKSLIPHQLRNTVEFAMAINAEIDRQKKEGKLKNFGVSGKTGVRTLAGASENFHPLVRRTPTIDAYLGRDWVAEAEAMTAKHTPEMLERAASYLLLNDSRASFNIESEEPSADKNRAWAQAIGQTLEGREQDLLTKQKLEELQEIIMGQDGFIELGIRKHEGFIGRHDHWQRPKPVWISAKPDDLNDLLDGLIHFARVGIYSTHPIVAAAILSFGFVYIHPFADGNGRLHRYLIHYVLSKRGMHPEGMIFPISVAILRNLREYEKVLNSYSARALPCFDWAAADDGNVVTKNETADLYRYWDATPHVEFLFKCVDETLTIDLPNEFNALMSYDRFEVLVDAQVNIAQWRVSLLFTLLNQNGGRLSKGKRKKLFEEFTDEDVTFFEGLFQEALNPSTDDD